jgi:N-acetyltransferase 10
MSSNELEYFFSPFDVKRLESYANNTLDYHVILDLLPTIATFYFDQRMTSNGPAESSEDSQGVRLTAVQSSMFLALGLQRKSIEEVEVSLPESKAL